MAERVDKEPEWFKTSSFCREVLNFCFREFSLIPPISEQSLNIHPEEFRNAVKTVGKAVFTLQMTIRSRLIPIFVESVNIVGGGTELGNIQREIYSFMNQGYLYCDIFNFTLSSLAVVSELIQFLNTFGVPLPVFWYHVPWCGMYEHRLRDELLRNGGWEALLEKVRIRYIDSKLYEETLRSLWDDNPTQYEEVSPLQNWPEDPLGFLHERFGGTPRNTSLAMDVLERVYSYANDGNIFPVIKAGERDVREMLNL